MERGNRKWVKTAAIIFFAAMLLLTFFSNTIMNWSLPEVTGQRVYGGEISTAVTGSGTVTSNGRYSVTLPHTREVAEVLVRAGDTVEAGQTLFILTETELPELQAAINALELAESNVQIKRLNQQLSQYDRDANLTRLRETLRDAEAIRDAVAPSETAVAAAQSAYDTAVDALKSVTEEIAELNVKIAEVDSMIAQQVRDLIELGLLDGSVARYLDAVEAAQTAYNEAVAYKAKTAQWLAEAQVEYSTAMTSASSTAGLTEEQKELKKREDAVAVAETAVAAALADGLVAMNAKYGAAYIADPSSVPTLYADICAAGGSGSLSYVNTLLASLLTDEAASFSEPTAIAWLAAKDVLQDARDSLTAYRQLTNASISAGSSISQLDIAQNRLVSAQQQDAYAQVSVTDARGKLDAAQAAYDDAVRDVQLSLKRDRLDLLNERKPLEQTQKSRMNEQADAEATLSRAKSDAPKSAVGLPLTIEDAEAAVLTASRALERAEIEKSVADAVTDIETRRDANDIADKRNAVERLRGEQTGTEVQSQYGGIVASVNTRVGAKPVAGTSLAEIALSSEGFTLEISVTNEDAARLYPGDIASVTTRGLTNVTCTLRGYKRDAMDPANRRILEFDVNGAVADGQLLDITAGASSQYYRYIVPNTAIREDAGGAYVLVAVPREAPLGTRYFTTRVSVEVLDKDRLNTAVNGQFDFTAYVIVSSSKPIAQNTQVRIAR